MAAVRCQTCAHSEDPSLQVFLGTRTSSWERQTRRLNEPEYLEASDRVLRGLQPSSLCGSRWKSHGEKIKSVCLDPHVKGKDAHGTNSHHLLHRNSSIQLVPG